MSRVVAAGNLTLDGVVQAPGHADEGRWTPLFDVAQLTVSHHLRVLVDAGLLTRDKRGVWAYFAVVPEALNALSAVLATPATTRRTPEPLQES